jgi:hypothetical protein
MNDTVRKVIGWIKSIWSEPDGSGSSTRVHITVLIVFILGMGLSFGIATHQKRITMEQFNSFLNSAGTFLVTTCGPLYGLNKAADVYKNKDNNKG